MHRPLSAWVALLFLTLVLVFFLAPSAQAATPAPHGASEAARPSR